MATRATAAPRESKAIVAARAAVAGPEGREQYLRVAITQTITRTGYVDIADEPDHVGEAIGGMDPGVVTWEDSDACEQDLTIVNVVVTDADPHGLHADLAAALADDDDDDDDDEDDESDDDDDE